MEDQEFCDSCGREVTKDEIYYENAEKEILCEECLLIATADQGSAGPH